MPNDARVAEAFLMLFEDVYINLIQMYSKFSGNKKLCAKDWSFEIGDKGSSRKETIQVVPWQKHNTNWQNASPRKTFWTRKSNQ